MNVKPLPTAQITEKLNQQWAKLVIRKENPENLESQGNPENQEKTELLVLNVEETVHNVVETAKLSQKVKNKLPETKISASIDLDTMTIIPFTLETLALEPQK